GTKHGAKPLKFNLHERWNVGLKQRPDLLKQKELLEQAGYQVRYSRNQLLPDLELVGTAGLNASSPTFEGYRDQIGRADNPFYTIGGQLTIPLTQSYARNKYKANKAKREQS